MLQGDPKVVAALAVAVLAVSPVVNAIMLKAADQADTDLLRDHDEPFPFRPPPGTFQPQPRDGEPPEGEPPEGEPPEGEGPAPPPQVPPCQPALRGPEPVFLQGPGSPTGEAGALTLTTEPGDVEVVLRIEGQNVMGQPTFALLRDGEEVWSHDDRHLRDSFTLPPEDQASHSALEPDVEWELTWRTGTAVYDGIGLSLAATHCGGGSA